MKNKKFLFVIFILTLTTTACRKERSSVVEGKVLDKNGGAGIPNATVYLLEDDGSSSSIFGSGYGQAIAQTTTASDGSYRIDFDEKRKDVYRVSASHPESYTCGSSDCYVSVDRKLFKKIAIANIPLTTHGYLRLHIKNTGLYGGDSFSLQEYVDVYGNGIRVFYNNVDTTIRIYKSGNFNNEISAFVYKSGNFIIRLSYYVYCPAFDTTDLTINY